MYMGDLTLEILVKETMVLMCGIWFHYEFRDQNPLQFLNIDYDVTWLIENYMYWCNFM